MLLEIVDGLQINIEHWINFEPLAFSRFTIQG